MIYDVMRIAFSQDLYLLVAEVEDPSWRCSDEIFRIILEQKFHLNIFVQDV